jgi:hypothetical protein
MMLLYYPSLFMLRMMDEPKSRYTVHYQPRTSELTGLLLTHIFITFYNWSYKNDTRRDT